MQVPLLDLTEQHRTLRGEIEAALARVLDTNAFILGPEVQALEDQIATYCGSGYAIGCASGSDALLLALMALEIGPGDEVITTPYSFFASVSCITRLGATPVFVDIEAGTYNLDVTRLEAAISERTRAILPVHLYGQCADMDPILAIAGKHGIPVIEDAAQAIGAEYQGRVAGSIGLMGCFSFYPSKNLGGTGDGGMVTTSDAALADKLRALRVHGSEQRYFHKWVGLNSRLDGFQGAVLRAKFPYLDEWTERRRRNASTYIEMFGNVGLAERVQVPLEAPGRRHIYNQFVISVAEGRDELRSHLGAKGVGTDVYYPVPLHLQECFAFLGYKKGDMPAAEAAAQTTLALPVYPELRSEQLEYVVKCIEEFYGS
jgi:dTDP-4-amino-4,6-dideoxygalactose transaminase